MKILIVPDKFKGSLSSGQVSRAIAEGLKSVLPGARITRLTVSDGGEGFLKTIEQAEKLTRRTIFIPGPLGTSQRGCVGFSKDRKRAYIESCQATGLHLVPKKKRDPFRTSSRGLAGLMRLALRFRPREIFVGLGSSSTCDAGIPVAKEFGHRFLDAKGQELDGKPGEFGSIKKIQKPESFLPCKHRARIYAVSDVVNPPFGKTGAIRIYTRQKGASPRGVKRLEKGMRKLVSVMEENSREKLSGLKGGGAAGCLALGLHHFFGARIISGTEFVSGKLGLEKRIRQADAVITGEGSFDEQSFYGKIAGDILRKARDSGKRTFLVTGRKNIPADAARRTDGFFSVEARVKKGGNSKPDESIEALRKAGKAIGNILKRDAFSSSRRKTSSRTRCALRRAAR